MNLAKIAAYFLYAKKAIAATAVLAGVIGDALSDGVVSADEYGLIAGAALGVAAVFGFKNGAKPS